MTQVSIIIPVYNVEDYLEKCIKSILNQTYNDFELILINDGSNDGSLKICERFKLEDNRIKLINQTNQGVGIARNSGLKIARGKYIYFCDADDYVDKDLLSENIRLAEEYNVNMVLFGNKEVFTDISKDLTHYTKYYNSSNDFREVFPTLFVNHNMHVLWNKLYKRSYIEEKKVRFSTRTLGEDSLFNKQIYNDLEKVYVNNQIYYYHINRFDSAQNAFSSDRFKFRLKETTELELLFNSWGILKNNKDLIKNDWIKTLFIGLENVFHRDNNSNIIFQRKAVSEIASEVSIVNSLKEISISDLKGIFKKCIVSMLKLRIFFLIVIAFRFKNYVKKLINK
ncbi:glycosyltransferase family 2 protein [Terribacillus sp. DMT04]|uniref:glycosyltransferase family 2 protein n=1 Tax=Terribacillus sp. DMT04 TaxID=2850441 RepID=UPI001C2C2754|nr:glycosyltransferase family 2 protein [Terribacillus sp. DMT04]QXE01062.1 glycosyltransferase [Terribacillus sp. DMT04]